MSAYVAAWLFGHSFSFQQCLRENETNSLSDVCPRVSRLPISCEHQQKHRQALDELVASSKTSLDAMRKETQVSAAVAKERAEREHRREELDK